MKKINAHSLYPSAVMKTYIGPSTKHPVPDELFLQPEVQAAHGILNRVAQYGRTDQLDPETWVDPLMQDGACLAQQLYAEQEGIDEEEANEEQAILTEPESPELPLSVSPN